MPHLKIPYVVLYTTIDVRSGRHSAAPHIVTSSTDYRGAEPGIRFRAIKRPQLWSSLPARELGATRFDARKLARWTSALQLHYTGFDFENLGEVDDVSGFYAGCTTSRFQH